MPQAPATKSLRQPWNLVFLAIAVLLALNGAVAYRAVQKLLENDNNVAQSLDLLVAVKETFSAVQEAEIGLSAYLAYQEQIYLEPYHRATNEVGDHLRRLHALSTEMSVPVPTKTLAELIANKLQISEEILLRDNLPEFSIPQPSTIFKQENQRLMEAIRTLVAQIETEQYALLQQRRMNVNQVRWDIFSTLWIANGFAILALITICILAKRVFVQQQRSAAALIVLNNTLEEKVTQRTAAISRFSQELQRSNRELQDFAFVASHDLQEPLRKIRTFGDRLQQKYSAELGEGADYVQRMQNAAERMSRLIEDLLTFSRVSSRAEAFAPVSLQAVLDDVLDDLEITITQKQAQIDADPLPEIEADPTQMHQLLQNLLSNALKFGLPNKTPRIRIRVQRCPPPGNNNAVITDWYEISIQDNGIGFDEQYLHRIFTPFQRLHGRSEYTGTGIGLAVCRRIVERHNGTITASSRPGEGATFTVTLPCKQASTANSHFKEEAPYEP